MTKICPIRSWLILLAVAAATLATPIAQARSESCDTRDAECKRRKKKSARSLWIRPQGQIGYDSFTVSGEGETIQNSGPTFELPVQVDGVILPHMLHIIGEGGLGFGFLSGDASIDSAVVGGISTKWKFNPVFITLGGGLAYLVTKEFDIELMLNQDIGITGSAEAKSEYGTTGFDIESFKRFHVAPGVRYELSKDMAIGAAIGVYSGTIQLKNLNEGEVGPELKTKGTQFNFFVAFTL